MSGTVILICIKPITDMNMYDVWNSDINMYETYNRHMNMYDFVYQ